MRPSSGSQFLTPSPMSEPSASTPASTTSSSSCSTCDSTSKRLTEVIGPLDVDGDRIGSKLRRSTRKSNFSASSVSSSSSRASSRTSVSMIEDDVVAVVGCNAVLSTRKAAVRGPTSNRFGTNAGKREVSSKELNLPDPRDLTAPAKKRTAAEVIRKCTPRRKASVMNQTAAWAGMSKRNAGRWWNNVWNASEGDLVSDVLQARGQPPKLKKSMMSRVCKEVVNDNTGASSNVKFAVTENDTLRRMDELVEEEARRKNKRASRAKMGRSTKCVMLSAMSLITNTKRRVKCKTQSRTTAESSLRNLVSCCCEKTQGVEMGAMSTQMKIATMDTVTSHVMCMCCAISLLRRSTLQQVSSSKLNPLARQVAIQTSFHMDAAQLQGHRSLKHNLVIRHWFRCSSSHQRRRNPPGASAPWMWKFFFAPPDPPMTPLDTAVDAAVAFTKDPTDSKAVQHALSALTPNPIFHESLRQGVEKATDARMFGAFRLMLIEAIPEGQPRQANVSATNLQLWRTFFATDNGNSLPVDDADAVKSPSADSERGQQMQPKVRIKSTNDINKVSVTLPKFNGSRGKCTRWWKKVRKTLESTYPGFDSKEKNQWLPVIRGCLQGCQAGYERLEQCEDREPKLIGTVDKLDVYLLMEKFVKSYDRNSKGHLLQEWRALSQNDRELIDDFKTRFFGLVADLKEQGHVIPPNQLCDYFRDMCKESATLRIKKKEITDIDAAVDYIAEIEANAVKGTSKGLHDIPRSDRAGGNEGTKETFTDRKGKVRCTHCCGLKHGQSQCYRRKKGKPKVTLKERINLEDQRDKRRNGHNGRKGNLRGNLNNASQVLQQQVEKQGKAMNTLLTMLGGGKEAPQEPTLQDVRSMLHAVSPCEAAGPPPDAADVPPVDHVPSAEDCKPASAPTPTPSLQSANSLHGSRKVSMTNIGLRNSKGQFDTFAALWDSGAMPESHVNLHTVKALGLQRLVKVHRENHKNAQDQSTFSTIGSIELEVNLNGEVVPCTFKVAPVHVNIILGQGFLELVGGVINVQPMIKASEWKSVGNIGAEDCMNGLPPPEECRKMHPGKNLRQTAEILERTPPNDDLTVEQGREHVKHLLDAKCKSIAVPRSSPSPHMRPVRLRLKEGYEDVIVNVPPRPRPDRDWDRIENQGGDFKLRSEDRRDLSERREKCGLVHQVSDAHAEVTTEDTQRTHVPARSRRSLLCSLHLPDHQGEHTLIRRLQPHCIPNKQECVREFLKHCTCCTSEPQTLLRRESPKSKQQSVVQADKHLDVVQLDVCSCGDQNHLTFADVKTKRAWVRKLLKKGAAKKNKGAHKRKTLEQCVIWESSLGQTPKQLRMDNEDALIAVPHKNIRAHPACRPQNNGIMERAHQEIARLCRSMNSTPDEACKCLRVNLEPLKPAFEAGGGEEHKMKCGLASKQAQPSANIATASAHDGRTLEPGSLVLVKVHSRSRKKSDPAWAGPFEVQSRASTKSHFLKRNDRLSHRHFDDVKPFSLADETFKDSKVNPVAFEKGKSCSGEMPKSFDVKCENLNADCSGDWKGKTVWLGHPGGEELERVVSKLKLRGFKSAVLVVPEVPFRDWCATLEGIRNARWHGVEPGDEHQFWVDSSSRPHCKPPVAWWVVRMAGKGCAISLLRRSTLQQVSSSKLNPLARQVAIQTSFHMDAAQLQGHRSLKHSLVIRHWFGCGSSHQRRRNPPGASAPWMCFRWCEFVPMVEGGITVALVTRAVNKMFFTGARLSTPLTVFLMCPMCIVIVHDAQTHQRTANWWVTQTSFVILLDPDSGSVSMSCHGARISSVGANSLDFCGLHFFGLANVQRTLFDFSHDDAFLTGSMPLSPCGMPPKINFTQMVLDHQNTCTTQQCAHQTSEGEDHLICDTSRDAEGGSDVGLVMQGGGWPKTRMKIDNTLTPEVWLCFTSELNQRKEHIFFWASTWSFHAQSTVGMCACVEKDVEVSVKHSFTCLSSDVVCVSGSKCLTSLFVKKCDLSSWGALCEKFQVPQNDKWLSFAIEFHLVENKMAPEKNKRVVPDVALNSFQNCVDQCKARRTMEDAERTQLKGDAIDLNVLTGVVVEKPGIVVQSKGANQQVCTSFQSCENASTFETLCFLSGHVFVDTLIGAFDIGQPFDDKTLNIHVNKMHAGKQLDVDRHIAGNFTLTIRCLPENSNSFREIIGNFGHDDVDVLHAHEHDRRPQKPETSFAPMIDAHIIAKNGCCAHVDLGKRENLTITSSPKVTTVEGKSFTVDRKGDVMEHLCSTFCEERSAVPIAHGGQGFDACALLHHTRNCTQLNRHRVIANFTKAKVHSMTAKDDPSSQKELFQTKFNAILTKHSALHRFGNHWRDLGRSEGKSPDDASDDEETSLIELVKKSVSPTKGKGEQLTLIVTRALVHSQPTRFSGEKRPHTLRARVSPAKKAKTTKAVGKSIKRRTSDPPMCHVCQKPILPNEGRECAECKDFVHKDCLTHKSTEFKARFCSEACKKAHIKITRDAAKLWSK
eukprot:jgi/Bigna1/75805/fgenesh1_pg.37_\